MNTHQRHEQHRDIVVYDGECGFCHAQVQRLKRRDVDSRFQYVPRHEPWLEEEYPELVEHDFDTGMRLIKPDGTIHAAADAVYEVARQLPRWRWIAWLYRVPGIKQICRSIYEWIAARRHRFSGSCEVDPAQPRDSQDKRER